jgi:FkbM family methyltransferase
MLFISYSQNLEDVMLYRALKHVKQGFYIDVGAGSPIKNSVSKAFYDLDWSGINIEPTLKAYSELKSDRPNDVNLQVAISNEIGEATIYEISNSDLSTLDGYIAWTHASKGHKIKQKKIDVITLDKLWNDMELSEQEVHFLKIDIEGLEEKAISSNNWKKNRPWIVVVESTLPNSPEETHFEFDKILINNKYQLAYCDGLNRFYVSEEHSDLLPMFKYPPNPFDKFLKYTEIYYLTSFNDKSKQCLELEQRVKDAEARAKKAEQLLKEQLSHKK